MNQEMIFAGFGGQGVMLMGQILSYAGMMEEQQVSWFPAYGPEMRGGTANCTVVISDDEIGSPTALHPTAVIAMNLPSLDKYEPMIKPGGYLIVNEDMVNRSAIRDDIHVLMVPASKIAQEVGNERAANMVLLGTLEGNLHLLPDGAAERALEAHTAARLKKFISMNIEAMHRGAEYLAE